MHHTVDVLLVRMYVKRLSLLFPRPRGVRLPLGSC